MPFQCSSCRYSSNRWFNVHRHERRIHMAPTRLPQCCGHTFQNKAEYYRHCEEIHPGRRVNLTSQKKYGIRAENVASNEARDMNSTESPHRDYMQNRYKLRSRARHCEYDGVDDTSSESADDDDDAEDDSTKSTNETPGSQNYDTSSSDDTSSNAEASSDEGACELNDASDDSRECADKSSSDEIHGEEEFKPNNDEINEDDVSETKIDGTSAPIFGEQHNRENINREQSSDLGDEAAIPTPCDSPSSTLQNLEARQFERFGTSPRSKLPIKKRILQEHDGQNRNNIINSGSSVMGDRLYRKPINVDKKLEQHTSRSKKPSRGRPSRTDNAENVPPVPISRENETIKIRFLKSEDVSWHTLTRNHTEYLHSCFDLFR